VSDQLKIDLLAEALINGEPISLEHNSINSFDYFGSRCFNSATGFSIPTTIRYLYLTGYRDRTATYSEISDTQHDFIDSWQTDMAASTWTGCEVYSGATKIFSASVNQAYASQDILEINFHFILSGSGFTNDGFKRFGHLCLDSANTYTTFDDVALLYYGVERNRKAATYAKVSDTVHNLKFNPAVDDMITAFRIYNATSGGNYCYEKTFTQPRVYLPTYQEILKITLSQS